MVAASRASLPPARQADHLGWFGGLIVGAGAIFGLTLVYILISQSGHLHQSITWSDHLAAATLALHAPLALWGLVGTVRAAWHRRFGRALGWLLLTAWVLLVLVGGSVAVGVLVIGTPYIDERPGM
ncbi:hypothetical protein [Hymenobacter edaphi]|uniref:Uncharacterized protein n=1 Tax=Hymenobacter edaphi TaxID=2211146 RepID=A0A328B758_9BACT|nr:hypothetical protein [Hymenobacter edaphi]RAK63240.1 hypothetical protein DLM85_21890 [Hymenobacter edaphi]